MERDAINLTLVHEWMTVHDVNFTLGWLYEGKVS